MSEEITDASVNVPRSMMVSILLNGVLGFSMLIAVLFCVGNVEDILETPTGYPFLAIFQNAVQSNGGAAAMAAVVTVLGVCATIAFVASSSRMTWSFARDHGLPFWRYLSKVITPLSLHISVLKFRHDIFFFYQLLTGRCILIGRAAFFYPPDIYLCHGNNLLPPRPHQYRLLHGLQRCHLPHHQRPLRLLLHRFLPPSHPPPRRLHRRPYNLRIKPQTRLRSIR